MENPYPYLLPIAIVALIGTTGPAVAQNGFEIAIPVPGLTNVAGGVQLPDGGFVFGGELTDGVVVVRTDSNGTVLWTRSLAEGASEEGIYDRSIAVSGNRILMGGYALGPNTATRDGILHVLDLNGHVLDQRLIDVGFGSNAVHSVSGMPGGALIAGRAPGEGSYDMLMQKVDSTGQVLGSWSYGSSGWDWAYQAIALQGGGMGLIGYGDGVGGPAPSAYLVRTDGNGAEVWARGIDGGSSDEAYVMLEDTTTGDIFVGGTSLGMGTPAIRGFISKFDADGNHQWTRTTQGDNVFDVIGLAKIGEGRYSALARAQNITGGHGDYDALMFVFSAGGSLLTNQLYGTSGSEYPVDLSQTNNGSILTALQSNPGGVNAIYAVLTDSVGMGGCTGIPLTVEWNTYTPTIYEFTSTEGSDFSESDWPTDSTLLTTPSAFICCTYPVSASFTMEATGDPLTWNFTSTSTGIGDLSWTIDSTPFNGDGTHTFPGPGVYEVCQTINGLCADSTSCQSLIISAAGVDERGRTSGLKLRPQPASDWFQLTSAEGMEAIEVCDATGRIALSLNAEDRSTTDIDGSRLPVGLYVVRVRTPQGVSSLPLLIAR